MNEGYIFIISAWLTVVLLMTHWLDYYLSREENIRQSRRKITFIILVLLSLQGLYIPVGANILVNVGSCLFLTLLILIYYWKYASEFNLQFGSIVIFLGIFNAVAYELFYLDPILMILPPQFFLPILFTTFVVITLYHLPIQLLAIIGGSLLGEILHKLFIYKHVQPVYIGDALFRDQLAVAIMLVFCTNLLVHLTTKLYMGMKQSLLKRKRSLF